MDRRLGIAALLGAGALLSALTYLGALSAIDQHLFGQGPRPSWAVEVTGWFSWSHTAVAVTCLSLLLLAFGQGLHSLRPLVALVGLTALEVLGKLLLVQPAGSLPDRLPGGLALDYSLPSGHALRCGLLVGLAWTQLPWPLRLLAAFLLAIVSATMVSVGGHYPSDVLVGALLGLAGGLWAAPRPTGAARQADGATVS